MTRRGYSDFEALSPSGKLLLECLSPDNGNDLVRNGARIEGSKLGAFQRNFRYRLLDTATNEVIWERWQDARAEPSPVAAFVSDEGWVVVRAHYMSWSTDQLLFFSLEGKKELAIVVGPEEYERESNGPGVTWLDTHVSVSTAGPCWTAGSFSTFVCRGEARWFSLRAGWGRRLVVDLKKMSVVADVDDDLVTLIEREERRRALEILQASTDAVVEGRAEWDEHGRLLGAIVVAAVQKTDEATAYLQALQRARGFRRGTVCSPLGGGWTITWATVPTLARLTLRRLGHEPRGGGNYTFGRDFAAAEALAFDESRKSAAADLSAKIRAGATGPDVVAILGAPDHVERSFDRAARVWSEVWCYDAAESTTRLVWSTPTPRRRGKGGDEVLHVVDVDTHEAEWRDEDRLLAVLGLRLAT